MLLSFNLHVRLVCAIKHLLTYLLHLVALLLLLLLSAKMIKVA